MWCCCCSSSSQERNKKVNGMPIKQETNLISFLYSFPDSPADPSIYTAASVRLLSFVFIILFSLLRLFWLDFLAFLLINCIFHLCTLGCLHSPSIWSMILENLLTGWLQSQSSKGICIFIHSADLAYYDEQCLEILFLWEHQRLYIKRKSLSRA